MLYALELAWWLSLGTQGEAPHQGCQEVRQEGLSQVLADGLQFELSRGAFEVSSWVSSAQLLMICRRGAVISHGKILHARLCSTRVKQAWVGWAHTLPRCASGWSAALDWPAGRRLAAGAPTCSQASLSAPAAASAQICSAANACACAVFYALSSIARHAHAHHLACSPFSIGCRHVAKKRL